MKRIIISLLTLGAFSASTCLAATIIGEVNITSWSSVYFSDGTYNPSAYVFGGVENSIAESDQSGGFAGSPGSYSVTYADSSAAGSVGTGTNIGFGFIYPNVTASASLDIDLTGAPPGTSAEGVAIGATTGTSFDASDGSDDGNVGFTIDFTIDASVAGNVDGEFGIQIDVFNATTGDLAPVLTPFVTGTGIAGSEAMAELGRIDAQGDAWTFSLTAAEILALGGSIDGTYTATFLFSEPNDPGTGNSFTVNLNAFATGNGAIAIPEPSSFALALGSIIGLSLMARRRRK